MTRANKQMNVLVTLIVAVIGLAVLFPFFWMVRSSFMSNIEIHKYPPLFLPTSWRLDNYPYTLSVFPSFRYMINTLTITLPSVLGVLLTSTLAAYAFARLDFPLKRLWFTLIIGSMLMPGAVTIIPIFVAWSAIGLSNGYTPLIVPAFLGGFAVNIFLCRQFLMTIPRDLDEAAIIDGASHVRVLFQILVPLIRPVLIAIGLFTFILYWNDILGPLIYISRNEQNTISQALANFRSGFGTDWKSIMAASCMAITPPVLLYFIGQRYFIEGIVLSGLKA
ncbi:MAG: carbohydrate ABC transporter permease [Spirochaetia bacterium]|jgi:multiple sugar transport system permease protein|nr:carbohydrate ABC transporter permease [Spirochaetia bacterium]